MTGLNTKNNLKQLLHLEKGVNKLSFKTKLSVIRVVQKQMYIFDELKILRLGFAIFARFGEKEKSRLSLSNMIIPLVESGGKKGAVESKPLFAACIVNWNTPRKLGESVSEKTLNTADPYGTHTEKSERIMCKLQEATIVIKPSPV